MVYIKPLVVVIILNTNHCQDTLECLLSVTASNYKLIQIVVLDNASTDGSVEAIRSQYPGIQLVSLPQNKGYAGNNNFGIHLALEQKANWILVLNEDTIMSADCIERLVEAGEEDPEIGVVGPLVYHYNEPTVIQSAGALMDKNWLSSHIGQNEIDTQQYSDRRFVDWISGCAIMLRRSLLEQVRGYEERFFYYNEEVELCFRARKAGWKVLFVPEAKLWHKGVQRIYKPNPNVTYYYVRNQLLFLNKHSAPLSVKIINWFIFIRMIISWTIQPKWNAMHLHRDAAIQAINDYLRGQWGKRS